MPKTRVLAAFDGVDTSTKKAAFKVYTPDSRLRTKISVMFVPKAGGNPLTGIAATGSIWLSALEMDQSGVSGTDIPVTNLEGTEAVPTPISAADGLYGYSKEFVTASDAIRGVFSATGDASTDGVWVVQVRYQPIAVSFTDAEWTELRTRMGVEVQGLTVAAPCEDCATIEFDNGPYAVSGGSSIITVVDLKPVDMSCFTPGNTMYFKASIVFDSPADWPNFPFGPGAATFYLGGNGGIGDTFPPTDIFAGTDGGGLNYGPIDDPGPASTTPTKVVGPTAGFIVPASPGNAVPLKLVLSSNALENITTTVISATVRICDHPFS